MPATTPRSGSNARGLRLYNQAVVLDAIRRHDAISRVEIAGLTGLASQTVTNISRRLIERGIIEESGKIATPLGKSRTALRPKPNGLVTVGVQFDPDASRAAIMDLSGRVLLHKDFSPRRGASPESVLLLIAETVQDLVKAADAHPDRVLGIGVGVPGPLDPVSGLMFEPPHLQHWHDIPLRDRLHELTNFPIVMDKDVTAAVAADAWSDTTSNEHTTGVIYVGTGIGLGVSSGGEILRGSSGNAGEVGHVVVEPEGLPCECGMLGCLGATSSPSSLVERFTPQASSIQEGMQILVDGAGVQREWDEALERASQGLINLARTVTRIHDFSRIRFGGPMWPWFADRLTDSRLATFKGLGADPVHPVECRASELGADLGTIGAASLVFDRFLSPRPSQLVPEDAELPAVLR